VWHQRVQPHACKMLPVSRGRPKLCPLRQAVARRMNAHGGGDVVECSQPVADPHALLAGADSGLAGSWPDAMVLTAAWSRIQAAASAVFSAA